MMNLIKVFVLFVFMISKITSGSTHDINFLQDFFRGRGSHLTAFTCWNMSKAELILKNLYYMDIFARVYNSKMEFNEVDIKDMKNMPNNYYFVFDFRNCSHLKNMLGTINASQLFSYSLKFLVLIYPSELSTFLDKLSGYWILPSCEIVLSVFHSEDNVVLHQPYRAGKNSQLTIENYGTWSSDSDLLENYKNIPMARRRSNLQQVHLVVGLVMLDNDTWNHLTDFRYPGIDTYLKQDFETMRSIFEYLNITYSMTATPSYGYYYKETDTYDGLVAEIFDKKVDVAGCGIFMNPDRYKVIDYMKMGNPLNLHFIVRKPSTSYVKNIFFLTFANSVWIALFVIAVITAFTIRIILNWETVNREKLRQEQFNASDVTLIALEAVCQQGTTTEPKSISGRILLVIFFGALMFIYVSYSANIVVLLQSTTEIKNLRELVETRMEVGGLKIHYMKKYFESAKDNVLEDLYKKKILPYNNYFDLGTGMKKLRQGNFAYHTVIQPAYQYILSNFTNYDICSLQELPGYVPHAVGYVPIQKHSPYKELFKVALLRADESGIQRRTNSRVVIKPRCFSQSATFKSVSIYDCYQVFFIWLFGFALGFVIFTFENMAECRAVKNIINYIHGKSTRI